MIESLLPSSSMIQLMRKRKLLYLIPLKAIMWDWGSTIIVLSSNAKSVELNPIAQPMGIYGMIGYALAIVSIMALILFKWGIRFEGNKSKEMFLTDWLAIALTIQGTIACLNNLGWISVAQSGEGLLIFGGITCGCAAVMSLLINRQILFRKSPGQSSETMIITQS